MCCDLDGVVWRGDTAIAGSADAIARLRGAGWHVVFTTNNSSLRIVDYVQRLAHFDIPADPDDVCTSAQAAAAVIAGRFGAGRGRCWHARDPASSRHSKPPVCTSSPGLRPTRSSSASIAGSISRA